MSRFFVNRPIVAMVMSIITVMLGLVAMKGLPIAQYPDIVPPMIQVTTTFIGASATDVEASYGLWSVVHVRQPSYEIALRHRFDTLPSLTRDGAIVHPSFKPKSAA